MTITASCSSARKRKTSSPSMIEPVKRSYKYYDTYLDTKYIQ
jgi:hypothetical protein